MVLDIGCADRRMARLLPPGCDYVGLDYPGTAVAMYGTRPDLFADAVRLPFRDASIDAVIIKDVLEHVRGPGSALSECGRVLKPGGRMMLWMPFLYPIHDAPYDYQRFTAHGLNAYLRDSGFEIQEVRPVLGSIESAGLMVSLALADVIDQIMVRKRMLLPIVPVLACLVAFSNIATRGLAWLPSTDFMPAFYRVDALRRIE